MALHLFALLMFMISIFYASKGFLRADTKGQHGWLLFFTILIILDWSGIAWNAFLLLTGAY